MMVISVNENLLNELILEKIIFALAIECTMIEMMATNHHPILFYFYMIIIFIKIYSYHKARTVVRNIDECY
jgi:hypothetical protein